MGKPDTWYAYFHVMGSFEPADITARVGVAPTHAVREGEPGRYNQRQPCSRWELRSRCDSSAAIELHVKDVLNQLDQNKCEFQELSRQFGGTMEVVGYFDAVEPGIHFDGEMVRRIGEYGLAIDCDFYNSRASIPRGTT
jgi:hypothetical protein